MAGESGPVIGETERLVVRELNNGDAGLIHAVLNDPDFVRYVGDRGVRTAEDAQAYIAERIVPGYRQYGYGMYRVDRKSDGTAVGICGLVRRAG
ncbi:MAG: GNAT family N-acetyltransferase, partial [Woeseia sp.]